LAEKISQFRDDPLREVGGCGQCQRKSEILLPNKDG